MYLSVIADWKYNRYETEAEIPPPPPLLYLMWTLLIYNKAVLLLLKTLKKKSANSWFDGKSALIPGEQGVQT